MSFSKSLSFVLFLSSTVVANTPKVEILLRADSEKAHIIPKLSYFGYEAPLFSDSGDLFLKYLIYQGKEECGIVHINSQKKLRKLALPRGTMASALSLAPNGHGVFFEQVNEGFFGEGIFFWDIQRNIKSLSYHNKDLQFTSYPQMTQNGLFFRATSDSAPSTLNKLAPQDWTATPVYGMDLEAGGFLFAPAVNNQGDWAFKVRHHSLHESAPDHILFNGVSVLWDQDFEANSEYISFDNSIRTNHLKDLLFLAKTKNQRRGIFIRKNSSEIITVAKELETLDILEIPYFLPAMNEKSQVAFWAINREKKEALYFWNGFELKKVLQNGDRIQSDLGWSSVNGFFQPPALNNQGEMAVQIFLSLEENGQDIGLGVCKISY